MQDKQWMLSKPVAFMVFNRPVTTRRVFEAIRRAKPPKLFVVADGPRADRENENKICAEVRAITEKIDWECEVYRNYADENMGCKERMASGITWVFQHVDECIIIEDDILPDDSFFFFAETMLDKYRDDSRVMLVSGCSRLFGSPVNYISQWSEYSYTFSKISEVWGWATWKRAWDKYDITMENWPEDKENNLLRRVYDEHIASYMEHEFQATYDGKIDTWDYEWFYTVLHEDGYVVMPQGNLTTNIGFGEGATHTLNDNDELAHMRYVPIKIPFVHPEAVKRDIYGDILYSKFVYKYPPFSRRILTFIGRQFKKTEIGSKIWRKAKKVLKH